MKTPAIQMNSSTEGRILHNIPSVSKIAPLPENKSHGILPVLSLDGRDSPDDFMDADDNPSGEIGKSTNRHPVGNRNYSRMSIKFSTKKLSVNCFFLLF